MDDIDRKIAEILQTDSRTPASTLAKATGTSVSTANERVRRMQANGTINAFRAVLNPEAAGASLCAFILIDMAFEGEDLAKYALQARPEVQELHHISGGHSYMAKIRVANTAAMQAFLQEVVKPLKAVLRTESMIVLDTAKETTAIKITP
ncbi:MAG TPA: Lrp/AsnC family transcriptional regulator [Rhodobacteraceae bacterium]|nr:Lrp/AsnC family transcriptional regulator [Paracoccaceae bacterium]